MKKLAFCIPTYNREIYLKECIQSILNDIYNAGLENEIQICISDNCSVDNTQQMISTLSVGSKIELIYHKNEQNLGPDLNYLKCIEISSAEYCWFMGSDDALIPGSLSIILGELNKTDATVYLSERINCTIDLKPLKQSNWFKNSDQSIFSFNNNSSEYQNYFNSCYSLGAIFSFLSVIIVKKQAWDSVVYDKSYTGTGYSHVFILLSLLTLRENNLKFITNHQFVLSRLGNDHFSKDGKVKRFLVDVDGYNKLSVDIFGSDLAVKKSFISILTREHDFKKVIFIRGLTQKNEWLQISEKLKHCYYNKAFLTLLNLLPDTITKFLNKYLWQVGLKFFGKYS